MTTKFTARLAAFGLSAIVTLAVLVSVDFLATSDTAPPSGVLASAVQPKG
jgi:hypothetical protein